MATKYVSGRVKELKVGISNYSESKESLSVIGIVSATKYYGDGSDLTGTQTPGIDTTGSSTFNSLNATHLKVTAISTYEGDLDIESSVLITGITTIGGLVDINAGGQANTFKVEDLTDNRVVIAGTGGELEDDANLTFNGTQFNVGSGITMYQATGIVSATKFYGDGSNLTGIDATALKDAAGNVKAQANPNGVVFTGIITGNGSGLTNLDIPGISTSSGSTFTNLNVTGITTLAGNIFLGQGGDSDQINVNGYFISGLNPLGNNQYDLGTPGKYWRKVFVSETVNTSGVNATGVSTFAGITTVTGDTLFTKQLNVSGVSTFAGDAAFHGGVQLGNASSDTINGTGRFAMDLVPSASGSRDLGISDRTWRELHIRSIVQTAGVSTFAGNIDANGDLDVDGQTDLDVLNVSDTATFAGNIDIADTIYHTGDSNTKIRFPANDTISLHTAGSERVSIDSSGNATLTVGVSVTGVSTFAGNINANGNIVGDNSTNITGIAGVTASTLTGTLQTAAQPNVTSLGTITNLVASSAKVSDLTSGRVVYAGASGELQDSANLTFNGTTLTASSFAGDGSQLTNLPGIDTAGGSTFNDVFSSGINTLGKGASGRTFLYDADSLKFQTTGIGVSVSSGTAKTAYIEGPEEIWIDPHPTGVGTTSGIVRIRGDLYVDGKEVIIDVDKLEIGDFQIGIASTAGTNVQLDGAGIGIGSVSIRKSITWNNTTSALMCSENWNLASGKHYEIAGTDVLTATTLGSGVVNSSLTSVGTLGKLIVGASGVNVSGAVTATSFAGNGAALTNVTVTGINTGASSDFTDLVVNGNLKVTGISTFSDTVNVAADKKVYLGSTNQYVTGDGSGNVQFRTNSGVAYMEGSSAARIQGGSNGYMGVRVAGTAGAAQLYYSQNEKLVTTNTGITVTGTCQATDFNSTSDIRLKDNIQVIEDPLAKLVQIEGVSFNWKENNKPALGVIADQVQEILPELVTDGDPKTVNYNGLIGLLIEAVKEQQIQIDELKSKLP